MGAKCYLEWQRVPEYGSCNLISQRLLTYTMKLRNPLIKSRPCLCPELFQWTRDVTWACSCAVTYCSVGSKQVTSQFSVVDGKFVCDEHKMEDTANTFCFTTNKAPTGLTKFDYCNFNRIRTETLCVLLDPTLGPALTFHVLNNVVGHMHIYTASDKMHTFYCVRVFISSRFAIA
jgi:hypothetical protein